MQQYNENKGTLLYCFLFCCIHCWCRDFFCHESLKWILVKSVVLYIVFFKGKIIVHIKLWCNMGNYIRSLLLKCLLLLIVSLWKYVSIQQSSCWLICISQRRWDLITLWSSEEEYYSASHSRVALENVGLQQEQKYNTFACHTRNEVRLCFGNSQKGSWQHEKIS
jgi:hypothetical protein